MESQTNSTEKSFATASLVFGILALVSFCTIVFPIIFGSLSILFAVLSHRKGQQLAGMALGGIVTSVSGIAISVMIIVMYIMMLPQLLSDEAFLEQMNTTYEAMYGQSFEEMLEDTYGMSIEDLFDLE